MDSKHIFVQASRSLFNQHCPADPHSTLHNFEPPHKLKENVDSSALIFKLNMGNKKTLL